jgi:hypothetical protein
MKKVFLFITAAIVIATSAAFAATTQDVTVNVEIPDVYDIAWAVSGSSVDLTGANAITVAEFIAGSKTAIEGGTLSATANANYDLTVVASAADFTGGSGVKPTSDLLVDIDSIGYQSLDGINEVTLISDHAVEVSNEKDIEYKILLGPTDSAGTYNTTLTYTIKAHI